MLSRPVLLALGALSLSYVFTPLTVPISRAVGAIDYPDGVRKINSHPVPRLGGLSFFAAALVILLPLIGDSPTVAALLSAGAILAAGGVADDVYSLPPIAKLIIQGAASATAILIIGIPPTLSFFGIFTIPLSGIVGFAIAVFRFLFTVNAVNFSDGLDGLASGLSAVALLSLALYGYFFGNIPSATAALVLAFAVLGFIPYNKYHAKVFMGDCGSQFLGLSIALLSLASSPGGSFTVESSLFLAIPTVDTVISVIRRIIKGKSPFAADKGHLHHILLKLGVPHPYAVNLLVGGSAAVAIATLLFITR